LADESTTSAIIDGTARQKTASISFSFIDTSSSSPRRVDASWIVNGDVSRLEEPMF
jgi:hypothetical protein